MRVEPIGCMGETAEVSTCDYCDGTENVTPRVDLWGHPQGHICEVCEGRQQDAASEDCFERAMAAAHPLREGY